MRSVLALLGGLAISLTGLLVVLATAVDLGGAMLIVTGSAVALLSVRHADARPS
ncbi:MAG TPA: hypothetical protein VFH63_02505 [candidate division Zixibacteria bacterium]|nr:hypothetical protein [candidate division Zixibacteria bacterium]